MASPVYAVVNRNRIASRGISSGNLDLTINEVPQKPPRGKVHNKINEANEDATEDANEGKSFGNAIGKALGIHFKKSGSTQAKAHPKVVEIDSDDSDEEENDDTLSVASMQSLKTYMKNGRMINIGQEVAHEQPEYCEADTVLSSKAQRAPKPKRAVSTISHSSDSPKTYENFDLYYNYLFELLNSDQKTDYRIWIGIVYSLSKPFSSNTIKDKQKLASKAIKLASEIKPIKPSEFMSFKDFPSRKTHNFCETIFQEYDKEITISTPVDYTNNDFSMSFYNSLFIQINKSNKINQPNINKLCNDFLQLINGNSLFESIIDFYNVNIGFQPTTQYEVAEFFKMLIGRCADLVYEKTKEKLNDKDKLTRIGKFPQNECFIALSAIGFTITLHIDLDKFKCIRIYKPVNFSKKPVELSFHLNNDGIFSCVS